jgi:hypothetical protein
MTDQGARAQAVPMPRYLLDHRHSAQECAVVFASWRGVTSPLRHRPAAASCHFGGHAIWWQVEAGTAEAALRQLPEYVAARTTVTEISEVQIP